MTPSCSMDQAVVNLQLAWISPIEKKKHYCIETACNWQAAGAKSALNEM